MNGEELKKILTGELGGAPENIKIRSIKHGTGIEIDTWSMYSAPSINFAMMKKLAEFFGTEKLDIDNMTINSKGCETCDHGSQYGHTIQILEPTKNVPQTLPTTIE